MTASGQQALGILGGTFDPVHIGHLRLALEVLTAARLDQVHLVPVSHPPHRDSPVLAAETRLQMLEAAVADQASLTVNPLELQRPGISYTHDTLLHLREQSPDTPLCLIQGMDAFASFNTWHNWQDIPQLAHIIVAQRPGSSTTVNRELQDFLTQARTENAQDLHDSLAGRVFMLEIPPLDISSTRIRAMIKAGLSTRYLLPEPVQEMIEYNAYYRASSEA